MVPMRVDDLDEVMTIEREAFSSPWSKQAFITEIEDNRYSYYITAKEDGSVVGYAGMWVIMREAHITNIAVKKEERRRRIGQRLLNALLKEAERRRAEKCTLEVRRSNETAQQFYEKNGFERVGVRRGYYRDTNEDALIMLKRLRAFETMDVERNGTLGEDTRWE